MPARSQRMPNGAIIQHGTVLCATRLYSEGVRIFSVAQVGLTMLLLRCNSPLIVL